MLIVYRPIVSIKITKNHLIQPVPPQPGEERPGWSRRTQDEDGVFQGAAGAKKGMQIQLVLKVVFDDVFESSKWLHIV